MRKVLLDESVSEDIILSYIQKGFQPHFQSKRKVKRKDKKVYNKIRKFGIDPATNLRFGDIKPTDWDVIDFGDPILDKLMLMGKEGGRVIKSKPVHSMQEAIEAQNMINDVELMFVKVSVKYRYGLRDDVPAAKSGSREFCSNLMKTPNKLYTLQEIQSLDNGMKDVDDVFLYRGGFYNNPNTGETTPFCRHQWNAEVVIE
jgi:hypothetical protein